jgi:hypothetical protein
MTTWRIRDRDVAEPRFSLSESTFATEKEARANFERKRRHAQEYGGSCALMCGGRMVESFSHYCRSE